MEYSKQGLALTESFESCRLTAYQDVRGIWTCGWGSTGPDIVEGTIWTQEQADSRLVMDMQLAVSAVNRLVTIGLSQGAFDAIVDFCYNCGIEAFEGSTMLKLINAGNLEAAGEEFQLWDHASGKVVAGLLRRRIAEEQEFTNGNQ